MAVNLKNSIVQSTYESIVFPKKIPYWLFWPLVALIWFILGETLSRGIGNSLFFWDRLIFTIGVATVPTVHIWLFYSFEKIMNELFGSIWERNRKFDIWLENSKRRIFTLHSGPAKIITGFIVVIGIATVFFLGMPFADPVFNTLGLLTLILFLCICGQALYIAIALLLHLREIVNIPTKVPFYLMPTNSISKLQNYYLVLGFSILAFYFGLVLAIWQGPYGLHPMLVIWLFGLIFYPLGILINSTFQIHNLMRNIKTAQIKTINDEIQRALRNLRGRSSARAAALLEKLMSIQEKVQQMKEWL